MSTNPDPKLEIFIEETLYQTRVALLENGVLQELQIERSDSNPLVGNIYKAKVERVLPGMQAAFVNIGELKNGFLGIKDLAQTRLVANTTQKNSQIETLLHQGQSLWVQVSKAPYADKGARLTTELSIPAQLLVYLPKGTGVGVSRKIDSDTERKRLRDLLQGLIEEHSIKGGFVVRTQAVQSSGEALLRDVLFLQQSGKSLSKNMQNATGVSCVHQELSLIQRILRDHQSNSLAQFIFSEQSSAETAKQFEQQTLPHTKINIEVHSEPSLLFDRYDVEQQIDAALEEEVSLPSGGSLIIQQTVAMTTIDVNTKTNLGQIDEVNTETSVRQNGSIEFNTNIEACSLIAQQVRLRNLSGIIVVDFIDMQKQQHKTQLISVLEEAFSRDSANCVVGKVSMLGLVEISRQRTRESLASLMSEQCPSCTGRGWVKNKQTICFEIFREIQRQKQQCGANIYTIVAAVEVIDLLYGQYQDNVNYLQKKMDCKILLKTDTSFTTQQFNIALNSR